MKQETVSFDADNKIMIDMLFPKGTHHKSKLINQLLREHFTELLANIKQNNMRMDFPYAAYYANFPAESFSSERAAEVAIFLDNEKI